MYYLALKPTVLCQNTTRYIAANSSLKLLRIAEQNEETGTKTSRAGSIVDWLTGH